MVFFTAASAARRKKPTFLKKPLHGWGMTNTRQNVTANGKSVWSVKLPRNAENNYGLLLWGKVGTGKSYFAGCIANALMEQEISVRMTNFSAILNDLTASFEGRNEYIERLCRFPLLILDDFGMERGTEYGLEQVYNVIDSRYRSRKPLIVTTNLSLTELQNPQDTAHARIYDRVLEMCLPILFTGENFRKETAGNRSYTQAKLYCMTSLIPKNRHNDGR